MYAGVDCFPLAVAIVLEFSELGGHLPIPGALSRSWHRLPGRNLLLAWNWDCDSWFSYLKPLKNIQLSVLLGLSLRGYHQAFGGKNSVVFPRSRFGRIFDRGASSRILRRWSSPLFIWFGKKISQHRYAFHVQLSSLIPDTSPVHLTNFASLCL